MLKHKEIGYYFLKIINVITFTLFSLIFEMIFFLYSFGWILSPLFFLDTLFLFALGSVIFFSRKTLFDKIYIPILLFIICMCFSLNTIYYQVTNNVFILENLKNLSLIFGRAEDHSQQFSWPIFFLFLSVYFVFLISFFIFNLKFSPKKVVNRNPKKIGCVALVGFIALYSAGLNFTSVIERNRNNLYIDSVSSSSVYNTKKLGLLTYYVKNLSQMLSVSRLNEQQLIDYFTDSAFLNDDFTGLLSGYNVITITIETGGEYMLNKYTTPNLYRVLNEGIHCNHNYSKNRTLYSELLGITGNIPSNEFENTRTEYKIPYGLPELLNGNDYNTAYFADIGNNNDVFDQKRLMKNLGYKNCYYHYDLMPNKQEYDYGNANWERDSDVFKLVIDKLKTINEKFYIHYTTMCMHARCTDEPCRSSLMEPIKSEFKSYLDECEAKGLWTNPLKGRSKDYDRFYNYTLCAMDFDKGLGLLLDYLNQSSLSQNTLLVVYGDHDLYEYTTPPLSHQISGKDNLYEIENYPTILGFYNHTLNDMFHNNFSSNEFNMFTSPTVIVPTILDLLGIKYNPKFYHGKSIFDPTYSNEVFYSMQLQKYMNENYLSDIGINIDKVFNDNNTRNSFLEKCSILGKQQKYIDYIYNNNIFATMDYKKFIPISN